MLPDSVTATSQTTPVKVFGIGFHKTATTSLADALTILGYRVTGPNNVQDPDLDSKIDSLVEDLADKFDAFQDNPWPLYYKELDKKYPGSKFILTIRSTDRWISSVVRHFGHEDTPMRKIIYGDAYGHPSGNEARYTEIYERHNRDVIDYFKDRPGDLLVFRITDGDGWDELCSFLGKPVPEVPFPCTNTVSDRERWSRSPRSPLQFILGLFSSKHRA